MGTTISFCLPIVHPPLDCKVILGAELTTMFQVSNVKLVRELPNDLQQWHILFGDGVEWEIMIVKPEKYKCPRCWAFTAEKEDGLCRRCMDVFEHAPERDLKTPERELGDSKE
jgi:hypothetical protein